MNCISLGFNVLYQFILKQIDDEELCKQHLLPLFEHWRNLIGQDKFYSETEKEAYISLAKKNAELVTLLPPIDKLFPVTIEKLYGLYGEALSVFFFSSIRGLFINCPEVIPRNEESYLGSWHYIFERLRYLEKCFDALIKHTGKEPVAFHTHCLVNLPQDLSEELSDEPLLKGQKKQLERLRRKIQPKSYRYLLNYFLKTTRRIIPDASERESLFDEAIGKFATHLLSMPPHKRIGEYKNVEPAVKCDLKDWSKNQRRKKRHSKGDVVSLNEDEKNENGKIDPALQTQPDLSFITWESILAACEDEYERQIIEFRVEGYTEKEIGEKLGKSQPYVNKKIRKIFEKWKKVE